MSVIYRGASTSGDSATHVSASLGAVDYVLDEVRAEGTTVFVFNGAATSSVLANTVVVGQGCTATTSAVAVGSAAVAGSQAVSVGYTATSITGGVAVGYAANASTSSNNTAVGFGTTATGGGATALGLASSATAANGLALGGALASGISSIALGWYDGVTITNKATAGANTSIAIGYQAQVAADDDGAGAAGRHVGSRVDHVAAVGERRVERLQIERRLPGLLGHAAHNLRERHLVKRALNGRGGCRGRSAFESRLRRVEGLLSLQEGRHFSSSEGQAAIGAALDGATLAPSER